MRKTILIVIALAIFASGAALVYYGKYRPLRNKAISLKSKNERLKKDLDAVWKNYVKLATMPRYKIDQHLDRIKIKKGSSLMFDPSAVMTITDTLQTDSVEIQIDTLKLEKRSFWDKLFGR